ncbi:shikimate dehydrogenase [Thalassotalea aquiviva]|uniref:shikimate dehydrogenase n=1 Tax=Thalassotalea aquiviva TaxID=3242415 RepID=UPI00352A4BE7
MDTYKVFGNPITQSLSPVIHTQFAKQTKQELTYQKQYVELGQFKQAITEFIHQGGMGANVTAPFKEDAMLLCDKLSEQAQLAGAVNTLSFDQGIIQGDNTDGVGLVNDLKWHNVTLAKSRVLILGAGGAAKGVVEPLLAQGLQKLVIANRTVSKAQDIVTKFNHPKFESADFTDVANLSFDVIINATSASLSAQLPAVDPSIFNQTTCYDMVYAKQPTRFLTWAKACGAKQCIDGLGMLVEQAAVSFSIWRGVYPDTQKIRQILRQTI